MAERPILFSGAMVRAILAGEKTQTRRAVKGPALDWLESSGFTPGYVGLPENGLCRYGYAGDQLWVRETFYCDNAFYPDGVGVSCQWREVNGKREAIPITEQRAEMLEQMYYRADGDPCFEGAEGPTPWRPSIHMPRWASRITLEITGVRVERLQAVNESDARAEGVVEWARGALSAEGQTADPSDQFRWLWESISGAGSWAANPWVWVVEFKRLEATNG